MSTCPSCATENAPEAAFCISCGTPLPTTPRAAPTASPSVPEAVPQWLQEMSPSPVPSSHASAPPARPTLSTRPPKNRSTAIVLEILLGLFGLLGIGWIYGGNITVGLIGLIGFIVWNVIAVLIGAVSGGMGCLCTLPMNLVIVSLSAIFLNSYAKQRKELFG